VAPTLGPVVACGLSEEEYAMATGVIGKGLFIKGELHGEDDLIIEGSVEGTITMQKNLIIETGGKIKANIETENIIVRGEMEGDLKAREKITIHNGGRLIGDISAPRVEVEDGAYYKGHIDMKE
jgi:cytoskeletal protein CcmA (bactofilin family)